MLKPALFGAMVLLAPAPARADDIAVDPYDVMSYSQSILAGEKTERAALDAAEDDLIATDALYLISGLDYQRFVVGGKTSVYVVLRDRHPDTTYHPLCEHNVGKFAKVGLVKAKNSLDLLSPTQSETIRDLAARCRAGTLNQGFAVATFERDLEDERGADHRLQVRDTVTTVARTLIGTYGVLRGYGRVPSFDTAHNTLEPN